MTIILDMGGVLMLHNMPECIRRFQAMLGPRIMRNILGLATNGEGLEDTLMEQYEKGEISTDEFINTILQYASQETTREDVIAAWNAMHGGIPAERLEQIKQWKAAGHRLFLLSNNNELHWEDINQVYDMSVFVHCFASHLMHASKPDLSIYESVDAHLKSLGCEEPFHFVDDIAINRHVAEILGWVTYPTLNDVPV
jgi:putative hydrolase of the HAD superfamily